MTTYYPLNTEAYFLYVLIFFLAFDVDYLY